ncbi:hypothetical protein G6O69_24750 [Pseudenhygromyxa sp. WMMC2535]|uniref:hypothetical protein n=1 Tax=Pseudenhygromyxa sp. WMMC2535 TaxID=2712867 RepID=UPI0015582B94|nr:hypothetical protein [Pseudenhygromyxa sp. WMMC2535]NVB41072.1 hypothetical protein [Pseudenhygromyxa sp. WMMC2535]
MLSLDAILQYFGGEDPEWLASVAPASAAEIGAIEARAERTLPPIYRRYLELLGREPGVLFDEYLGADPRVDRILTHYDAGGWRPPPPYTLFARDPEGQPIDLFLRDRDRDGAADQAEPYLVSFAMPGGPRNMRDDGPDRPILLAPELRTFVFRAGFDNLIGSRYSTLIRARIPEGVGERWAALDEAVDKMGMRHEHGSDAWTSSHRAHEAAIQWLRNGPDEPVLIRAWSDDEGLLHTLVAALGVCGQVVVDGLHPTNSPIYS